MEDASSSGKTEIATLGLRFDLQKAIRICTEVDAELAPLREALASPQHDYDSTGAHSMGLGKSMQAIIDGTAVQVAYTEIVVRLARRCTSEQPVEK